MAGLDVRGSSQIIPLVVGDAKKAVEVSEQLAAKWLLGIANQAADGACE